MKILIYRPDKKIKDYGIDKDLLYYPDGKKYKEKEVSRKEHPLDLLERRPIKPTYIEVAE